MFDKMEYRKLWKSCGRIAAAVLVIVLIVLAGYWLWSPGRNSLPVATRYLKNGIWLRHGWFADDAYFRRNSGQNAAAFRGAPAAENLMRQLKVRHIHYVYPHLCPAQPHGELPYYNNTQIGVFLDAAEKYDIQVIPWIGGVLDESARIHDRAWRKNFASSTVSAIKS